MKPSDHPEFFRLPPPQGQSRESTIVLRKDGRFFHEGEPIRHAAMARAFARWVGRHPDDGRYVLNNGYDWCYLKIEGTAFFVTAIRREEQSVVLELSDGTSEPLDPRSLRVDADAMLQAQIHAGASPARFTRQAQLQMEPLLSELADGRIAVTVGDRQFPLVDAS